jgi:Tol biopolymer transport system component
MNANGSNQVNLTNHSAAFDGRAAWSPDGSKIAFTSTRDGNYEIYIMNANGTGVTRLTNHAELDSYPAWSPDGLKIAFRSDRAGNPEVYVMNANGSGPVNLTNNTAIDCHPSWKVTIGSLQSLQSSPAPEVATVSGPARSLAQQAGAENCLSK